MNKAILETHRLILNELTEEYFEDLAKLLANPIVHKHFPKTLNRDESKEFLEKVQSHQKEDGYSFWAVIRKEDSQFLGICGLLKQHVNGIGEVEVGYRIDNQFWGNGYATEAAKGCMEYAKNVLKVDSIISLIRLVNQQSIRVAEKNGLEKENEIIIHQYRHIVYRKRFNNKWELYYEKSTKILG